MTIDEFILEETKVLSAFKDYWKEHRKNLPANYPVDMHYGEWGEQLQDFVPLMEGPQQ